MESNYYELTNPQKNIWNTEMYFSNTNVNNICTSALFKDEVDIDLLREAINELVKIHDSFRIKLTLKNSVPMQYFEDYMPFNIDCVTVNNMDEFKNLESEMVNEKFKLLDSQLYKFKLVKIANYGTAIILNLHHIIGDSWSLGKTIQDIVSIYKSIKNNTPITEEVYSYKNFIAAEQKYEESPKYHTDKEFWENALKDLPNPVSFYSPVSVSNVESSAAGRDSFSIEKSIMDKINFFCSANRISTYIFFMSVFSIYLANTCNTDDVIFGTPIINRLNYKDKQTTGMFISTIPFRIKLTDNNFLDFATKNNINLLSTLRHQKYAYSDIVEDVRKDNPDVQNLYNVAISYQVTKTKSNTSDDCETNWIFNNNCLNDINIHLHDFNETGNLKIDYDYLTSKYTAEDIVNHHNRILSIINQVLDNPELAIKDIQIVTEKEKYEILNIFNNRSLDCPLDSNVIALFEKQVADHPDTAAVTYKDVTLSYGELNTKVNQFARFLQDQGIKKNDIVGVYMNKTEWFIVSILALQKLGAAYAPMHPEYPLERVSYIMDDCKSKILITDNKDVDLPYPQFNPQTVDISSYDSSNLNIKIEPDTLCYVIYTSGSTGKPKGVLLSHKNLINFLYNFNDSFDSHFTVKDNCLSVANMAFDASVQEFYSPLCFGATLVIYPLNTLTDIPVFCDILEKEHITFSFLPPNILDDIADFVTENNRNFYINKLSVGVEAIKNGTLNKYYKLNPNIEIINGYGPSEATICSTFFKYIYSENESDIVPIGYPLKNNNLYILNQFNNLLPVGIPGELCIAGASVSIGYLNNLEKTKSAFVKIPKLDNQTFYRTGDNGFWSPKGYINFIGRQDSQVKFRGHRIELTEINNNIRNISGITNSITQLKLVNDIISLCSYVETPLPLTENSIKSILAKFLPYYMIPNHIVIMSKLPVTKSGKIDKKSLPEITYNNTDVVLPTTDTEKMLVKKLCKQLNLETISITDDFFTLGIDSLSAIRLSVEIFNDLKINLSIKDMYDHSTIKDLAAFIDSSISCSIDNTITKSEKLEYYPLSSAQKRIYFSSKMISEDNLVYNLPGAVIIDKILDKQKVENCFKEIIKKQSSFRTSFTMKNNEVVQIVHDDVKFSVTTHTGNSKDLNEIIENFARPFDLEKAPLLRVTLYYIDNTKTLLLIDSHHIIMDGSSLSILLDEFCNLYNGKNLEKLDIEYKDFSVWENNSLKNEKFIKAEKYWINKFSNRDIPYLNLPYDYNIPTTRSYIGNTISKKINPDTFNKYIDYSKKHQVSPYMFFISAFFVLLHKYCGQDEIFLGSPTSGRTNYALNNIIGMFVNNLVCVANIKKDEDFNSLLDSIRNQVFDDLTYQNYPYDLLVKKLKLTGDASRNPLFDVMFIYQNENKDSLEIENEKVNIISNKPNISKFNLSLEIIPDSATINLEYCTSLFKKDTIERLYEHYINTLNYIVKYDNPLVKDIEIISTKEKNQILDEFNFTATDYPSNKSTIKLFEEQVKLHPNKTAVVFDNTKLTYSELNEKANQLAHFIQNQGVYNEEVISIFLDKSIEMIIAILAILKNGCAYLPIDISYPKDRIEYILKDSNSKILLTSSNVTIPTDLLIKTLYIDLDNENIYKSNQTDNLNFIYNVNDLAYIMYTSGSTGKPKGVMIENKSIVRLVKNTNYITFEKNDRILQTGSIVFDACTFEIWGALLNGLELYIIKKEDLLDALSLNRFIRDNKITVLWLTAPLFNQLSEENPYMFEHVRAVLTGGDVLSCTHINLVRKCNPNLTIINGYGPTENTTFSCCFPIDKNYKKSIPIGKPIANSTGYIISVDGNLQPIGIPGELWVGGDGVARGYLNRPDLTMDKFINNPYKSGRIYKTGDLVKWRPDGTIDFLGRIDSQIKIRGFRVELSEITSIISQYKDIKEAYTIFKSFPTEKAICSFIVGKHKINIDSLKQYLSLYLPTYMIPKYIVQIKQIPKNQNGKVNKSMLPEIDQSISSDRKIIEPQNETQSKLVEIYKSILKLESISIDDNFFDYGGDSISAMSLQVEALRNGMQITYGDIFKYPTIKELADYVDNRSTLTFSSTPDNINAKFYDNLISGNNIDTLKKREISYTPMGNLLLTGVTGFLGTHILDSYLKNNAGKIYCLIRPKNYTQPIDRLKETLHFYFNDKYDSYIGNRIICVEGDITQEHLGLEKSKYAELGSQVNTVIHAAALVKHFGSYKEFQNMNIDATQKIIDFCNDFNLTLLHISTTSVSGNSFSTDLENQINSNEQITYGENKFYIKQNLDNLYVHSKFLAEQEVLNAINKGLKAYILRVGNLTSRCSEGKFQQNHIENAFVNRIKTFLQIKCIPQTMYDESIEFTPVDYCSDAIIKLANHYDRRFNIFHLVNDNYLTIKEFGKILNNFGLNFTVLSDEDFSIFLDNLLKDSENSKMLDGIIRDLNSQKQLLYKSNIHVNSSFSREFLKQLNFEWPIIEKTYIRKYLEYLIDIGFLNIHLKED